MLRIRPGFILIVILLAAIALTGCGGSHLRNIAPPEETVPAVQTAVNAYRHYNHQLPVKQRRDEASGYERYPVDFRELIHARQLVQVPSNAYENGGPFYYVLVPSGEDWLVRLIEMNLWQEVTDIQAKADAYRKRTGRLPADEPVQEGIYRLDGEALGLKSNRVPGVYSPQTLPLIITEEGRVYVDYAPEIMVRIQALGDAFEPAPDLREILIQESYVLPVHSLPYVWQDDQPVIHMPR